MNLYELFNYICCLKDSLRQESSRHASPHMVGVRSPAIARKCQQVRTPLSSPHLGRDKKTSASSCKDNFDYEESVALAMALSKSIYMETPLPVIPGLSAQKNEVLAHPQRDVSKDILPNIA